MWKKTKRTWVEERWLKNLAILDLLRRIPCKKIVHIRPACFKTWNSLQHFCCVGELSWSAGLEAIVMLNYGEGSYYLEKDES